MTSAEGVPAHNMFRGMGWIWRQLRRVPFLQRLIRYMRTGRINAGAGAGLWFDSGTSNPEYRQGSNEIPVQETLSHYLKAADVFYDIGANVGFFTVIAARLVGERGHVYAFEPVPENAQLIRRNVKVNGFENVKVFEKAVSGISGTGELQLAHYSGGASLATVAPPPDWKGIISVEMLAIDDLVEKKQVKSPDFVKIDVEGAELEVLQGMVRTVETFKPVIVFEIDDSDEHRFRRKTELCCTYLFQFGYQIEPLLDSYPNSEWLVGHYLAIPEKLTNEIVEM